MNGELLHERTKENFVVNAATRIGSLAKPDSKAVEIAYLVVLTRKPGKEELAHFTDKLHGTEQSARSAVMEDLYWTLMNSTEFSWNH